jgi:WD40 repeat protein
MPRTSRILFLLFAGFVTAGLVGTTFDVAAKDKKEDKKDPKKEDKKDPKKEDKIEKKDPFKPDKADQEFKYEEKDKTYWVQSVAFDSAGKTVAASYRDGNHTLKVWDLAAKKDAQTIKGKPSDVKGMGEFKSLLYVKDQIYVGSGHWNVKKKEREGELLIFDAKAGKSGKSQPAHSEDVLFLSLSKDGNHLATASQDKTVKIWDFPGLKDTQTVKGHSDYVTSVAFSPDGKQIVTTSFDKTLRVWTVADAKEIANFKVEHEIEGPKDPKSKDPKAKGKMIKVAGGDFTSAVFTSDGKKVIAGNRDGVVKIYDVEGKKELQELKAHEGVLVVALSPDGNKFATGGYDGTIKIWNAADYKLIKTIKAHVNPNRTDEPGNVLTLSFSPDNQWVASGSTDGVVKIWSVK